MKTDRERGRQWAEKKSRLQSKGLMSCRMFDDCWISAGPDLAWKLCQGRPGKRWANLSMCQQLEKARDEWAKVCFNPHKTGQQNIGALGPVRISACCSQTPSERILVLMGGDTSLHETTDVQLSSTDAASHQSELQCDASYGYLCHTSDILMSFPMINLFSWLYSLNLQQWPLLTYG